MMKKVVSLVLVFAIFVGAFPPALWAAPQPIQASEARFHPVYAENGMVATQDALATRVGVDILKQGGNAIDAAVAIGYALAVTLPRAGNLGGGGFMMVHTARDKKTYAIDYREEAPQAATADMFLDVNGNVDTDKKRFSYLSAGVPGTVAGLDTALLLYGTMSREDVMAPAIRLAKEGFEIGPALATSLQESRRHFWKSPAAMEVFTKDLGRPYAVGDTLIQKDLAWSLGQIATHGKAAFYTGEIADKIAFDMRINGGLITRDDLKDYGLRMREPLIGRYHGVKVATMPPPSSGGVHLLQMLNVLSHFPLAEWGAGSAKSYHAMAETMRLAYADRSKYLGDPDFVDVPVKSLTSGLYARRLHQAISMESAQPSELIQAGRMMPKESRQTTHFSVMDRWGNVVSNTYTLNFSYGSGIMVKGTGILLNNEMDDFAGKVGAANAYGLIGGDANKIEPRKRPLSSMTPTILFDEAGKPFLATGTPGGSRIITTVLQMILNVVDHKMNIAEATAAPRIHHQWQPDVLRLEKGVSPDTIELLLEKGHDVHVGTAMGSTQTVRRLPNGMFVGAADLRKPGALAAGF